MPDYSDILDLAQNTYPAIVRLSGMSLNLAFTSESFLSDSLNWTNGGFPLTEAEAIQQRQWVENFMNELLNTAVGGVFPYITDLPPHGALPCDGSTYNREDYPLLYELLDAAFVIDADTFMTPDLRDMFVPGAGGIYSVAEIGGENLVTLDVTEIPAHSHEDLGHVHSEISAVSVLINGGLEAPASAAVPVPTSTGIGNANLANTGGSMAHENRPQFLALKYAVFAG